jgi:CDP-diacylglycerol--glycerol-3-phosphate 3-phosphatidyltransferase/cardiolipin synthase
MRPRTPASFFSLEELLLPPNLITALRLPLAAIFPFAARSRTSALAVLAAAGLTDALDGWLARRNGQVTATGAVLDPIADKAFAVSVVTTLAAHRRIPAWGVPALLAREILEAPLLLRVLLEGRDYTGAGAEADVTATSPGKAATTAQLAAVMIALEAPSLLTPALLLSAVLGTAAGLAYWQRELAHHPP